MRFPQLLVLINVMIAGMNAHAAEPIPLRAGPLTMVFEPDTAMLRYVRLGADEVLRGISAPVRNEFWGTVPPQVKVLELKQEKNACSLKFEVTCREREVDFVWIGQISGDAKGKIEYTFDGEARASFKRNRIGFCVLHGETVAGKPWVLETTDGKKSEGRFPQFIAPHQPAKDLKAVAHEFAPKRWARIEFAGDVFEMEDQRNWTDASFKTYCTPLAIPYPVQLEKGARISQKITLTLDGDIPADAPPETRRDVVKLTVGKQEAKLPSIGLRLSSQIEKLSAKEIERLRKLKLDHLRVDLTPLDAGMPAELARAVEQAAALDTKLLAAVHLGDAPDDALERLATACKTAKPPVLTWLFIGADGPTVDKARKILHAQFPETSIGSGEDTNFTELNRNRPDIHHIDAVSYGLNPQVHATDYASIIETLPIQGDTLRSARQFTGNLPIIVSPVTLRVQHVSQPPAQGELPSNVDPRQASNFAAGWTIGSLANLSAAGANRITYYETVGWKGIMAAADGVASHDEFPARTGQVYPLYDVLDAVAEFAGGRTLQVESTEPAAVVGLLLKHGERQRLLIANLTSQPQNVALSGYDGKSITSRLHRDTSAQGETGDSAGWVKTSTAPLKDAAPMVLPPLGIVKVDRVLD